MCIIAIPTLAYAIKFFIPKRYTLYSNATIQQLGRYEYQLSRLKYKYEKLTKNLNELAFKSKDQIEQFATELQNDTVGLFRADTIDATTFKKKDKEELDVSNALRRRVTEMSRKDSFDLY